MTNRFATWGSLAALLAGASLLILFPLPRPLLANGLLLPLSAFLILALAQNAGPLASFLSSSPLRIGGEASYGIYILQMPLAGLLGVLPGMVLPGTGQSWRLAVFAVVLVTAAIASHFCIETPLRRALQGARKKMLREHSAVVVVHRGSRDAYQVAAALAAEGSLGALFTDLYWPSEQVWAKRTERWFGERASALLRARWNEHLPSTLVRQLPLSGLASLALDKVPRVPFAWRRSATRWVDAQLGRRAGQYAAKNNAVLLAYSYYAADAFRYFKTAGILFQLHPHPTSVRRILARELADHPDCAESLQKEWELSLGPCEFARLASEPALAAHCLVASSFTRQTLIENGTDRNAITVIPYGVDSRRFVPDGMKNGRSMSGPLQLLFTGTITQRKGIKYLLEALRLLRHEPIEVTVCGRAVDDLSLFKPFADLVSVRPSVSSAELLAAYQSADLFVLPSVAEGFAQVLLEAMACGLPILSTTHTAAPDLVEEGVEGFVIAPRRVDLLAERIEWALLHRRELRLMGYAARAKAEQFTHQRFRLAVADAVRRFAERNHAVKETEPIRQEAAYV